MARLRVKKPIERIAMTLTQFARDEQRFHLNWQWAKAVGECLVGKAPWLDSDLTLAPFEPQFPN